MKDKTDILLHLLFALFVYSIYPYMPSSSILWNTISAWIKYLVKEDASLLFSLSRWVLRMRIISIADCKQIYRDCLGDTCAHRERYTHTSLTTISTQSEDIVQFCFYETDIENWLILRSLQIFKWNLSRLSMWKDITHDN